MSLETDVVAHERNRGQVRTLLGAIIFFTVAARASDPGVVLLLALGAHGLGTAAARWAQRWCRENGEAYPMAFTSFAGCVGLLSAAALAMSPAGRILPHQTAVVHRLAFLAWFALCPFPGLGGDHLVSVLAPRWSRSLQRAFCVAGGACCTFMAIVRGDGLLAAVGVALVWGASALRPGREPWGIEATRPQRVLHAVIACALLGLASSMLLG